MTEKTKDTMDEFIEIIQLASKVKKALGAKGKRQGWTKCPVCDGKITAVLAGKKNHLHMSCSTPNCIRFME